MRAVSSPPNFGLLTPPTLPEPLRRTGLPKFHAFDPNYAKSFRLSRARSEWMSDENQAGDAITRKQKSRVTSELQCKDQTSKRSISRKLTAALCQFDGHADEILMEPLTPPHSPPLSPSSTTDNSVPDIEFEKDLPHVFRARRNVDDRVVFSSIDTNEFIIEDTRFGVGHGSEDSQEAYPSADGQHTRPPLSEVDEELEAPLYGENSALPALAASSPFCHPQSPEVPVPLDSAWPTPPFTPKPRRYQHLPRTGDGEQEPDLYLPNLPVFHAPAGEGLLDTPTPLTRAQPAIGAFPFPSLGKRESSLSPLAVRRLRPSEAARRASCSSGTRSPTSRPDRFIPQRNSRVSSADAFRIGKPVHKLTPREKLFRGESAGPDPFRSSPRTPGTTHSPTHDALVAAHQALVTPPPSGLVRPGSTMLGLQPATTNQTDRQPSHGAVWNVGGPSSMPPGVVGVPDGRGGMLGRGTSAPLYTASFLVQNDPVTQAEEQERRTALAIGVDPSSRVFPSFGHENIPMGPNRRSSISYVTNGGTGEQVGPEFVWTDNAWTVQGDTRVLDAESLRDDYYCSVLAYSPTLGCLAVGLANLVFLWTESHGVSPCPPFINSPRSAHITSLSFSSHNGGQAILAIGRADGRLALWSPKDEPHFLLHQPCPVACVCFRPNVTQRRSERDLTILVQNEDLLVGDEAGVVYYFSVEMPTSDHRTATGWAGAVVLLAKIHTHTQQICGLAWSPDGEYFATGGNDNCSFLFETRKIVPNPNDAETSPSLELRIDRNRGTQRLTPTASPRSAICITASAATHRFQVSAAVKALAFCPWQRGLIALGGGSNDRAVHFYHTISGAALATIDVAAQVTSLVWSKTRREICATFGFSSFPEHAVRVAVFSWPSCDCVVSIPWTDEGRALWAISYPGGPDVGGRGRREGMSEAGRRTNRARANAAGDMGAFRARGHGLSERQSEEYGRAAEDRSSREGASWWTRTRAEGCMVIATSEGSIKFHEVWADRRTSGRLGSKRANAGQGPLGGSDILESLHGIEKEGPEVIR